MSEQETRAEKYDSLRAWLNPQCSRLMYGRCTTLYCLRRGGYAGEPADASMATCEPYEIYNLLQPAANSEQRCVECCGHDLKFRNERGECKYNANPDKLPCGHRCEFATTGPTTCARVQDKSDYRWYKTACGRETDSFDGGYCTYCGRVIEIDGKPLEVVATTTRDATGRWATVKSTCGF